MSSDNTNVTPSELEKSHEEDEEQAVTMLDVLEEERDLEEDACAVLGGSDDQNCTYSQGYVPRQALYACMTCIPVAAEEEFKPAGICLACSYNCHEGHDLVELYTKRNFRCDCGNSNFGEKKCSLECEKDPENADNKYNQNFRGLYCSCKRPYPDSEDTVEDEMLQCVVCEDWFHGRHLNLPSKLRITSCNFAEMICGGCMEKHSMLCHYAEEFAVSMENAEVDVIGNESIDESQATKSESNQQLEKNSEVDNQTQNNVEATEKPIAQGVESSEVDGKSVDKLSQTTAKEGDNKKDECFLQGKGEPTTRNIAAFWPNGWRKKLCTCESCKTTYAEQQLTFLLNEKDMVQAYEAAGQAKLGSTGSQYEQGMRALSNMDRIRQLDAIHEYNKMQKELKEYLAKFAAEKRVVREEDIKSFFSELQARKRRRNEDGSTHFCH